MSQLEKGMAMIIAVFDKYSATEGDKFSLSKGELKTLLENEMPNFLESSKDKDALDKIMKELDENGDSQIDFNEYIVMVAACTSICHSYFEKKCPQ